MKIGDRFSTMVVTGIDRIDGRERIRVKCDCGVEKLVTRANLVRAKSCGCLTKQILSKHRTRHGQTDSPTWITWKMMLERCEKPYHKSFHDYGGRGIKVCASWHTYENFLADMGERPDGMQLDRVDNSKGYEPSNCRWATPSQNCNNRRSSRYLTFRGERLTIAQWARRLSGAENAIKARIYKGWSVDDALTKPFRQQRNSKVSGRSVCEVGAA